MNLRKNAPKENNARKQRLLQAVILCVALFMMLLAYWRELHFVTDECDVFDVGKSVASGLLLYRDVISQHMPVMYYISAVLFLLGANTYVKMRIAFYLLMAICWGGMYYRYSARFGKKVMAMYPVLYTVMLSHIFLGHAILSEQMQGIGYVLLLLELLQFAETRTITLGTCVIISLSILLTFGTAFVSAFAIAFVFCTVMGMEIAEHVRNKSGFGKVIASIFHKYWLLFVIVLAPIASIACSYLVTGRWGDFIGWAYSINREVYPKYNSGGYGGSILSGMYHGLPELVSYLVEPSFSVPGVVYLMLLFLAIMFFLQLWRKHHDVVLEIGVFAFLVGVSTRGVFEFHGLGSVAVLCLMASVALDEILPRLKESNWRLTSLLICALVFVSSYLELVPGLARISVDVDNSPGTLLWAVDSMTEKGELIGNATLKVDLQFESHTLPLPLGASTPWTWEWKGKENLDIIAQNPPRVFLYDEYNNVWGSITGEYAPELDAFVKENYTAFPEYNLRMFYVRNDCYEEARQHFVDAGLPSMDARMSADGWSIELTLCAPGDYESMDFPVWTVDGGQDDLHAYVGEKEADGTWKCTVDLHNHMETGDYMIHSLGRNPGQVQFVRELQFAVKKLPEA